MALARHGASVVSDACFDRKKQCVAREFNPDPRLGKAKFYR